MASQFFIKITRYIFVLFIKHSLGLPSSYHQIIKVSPNVYVCVCTCMCMCLYMPIKKDRTLIGGLGLINPLIEIIHLACALISLCCYLNKLYDYITVCFTSKCCFNTRCGIGLRWVNIFCLGRDFICTSGQEQTEANECEHKVVS